jgi:hypothetical protein
MLDGQRSMSSNVLSVKSGLDDPPLGAMIFTFTDNQALAQKVIGRSVAMSLGKALIMVEQRVSDVIRMVEREDVPDADLEVRDVAVFSRDAR